MHDFSHFSHLFSFSSDSEGNTVLNQRTVVSNKETAKDRPSSVIHNFVTVDVFELSAFIRPLDVFLVAEFCVRMCC